MLPKHRRGPWSQAEDQYLLELVRTQGASNWVRISQLIQSRSPKQCRERYHQNLKPSLNLDPISPEEGILIERMVAELGKRWAEIARRLHGRSDNAVKNWWNGGMNRRKRRDNRRAEMGPHHPHPLRPMQHSGTHLHPLTMPHSTYDQVFNAPQYRYEHSPAPTHVPTQPQPFQPQTRRLQPYRQNVESSLPSPSASSYVSRTDSSEGGPPSLVSDVSYSSYTQSPNTNYSSHELPSTLEHRDPYARQPMSAYSHNSHYDAYPTRDGHVTVLPTQPKEYFRTQQQYYPQAEQWKERSAPAPTPLARYQLPLPSFQHVAGIESRVPSSPPKDERMNVNALIH